MLADRPEKALDLSDLIPFRCHRCSQMLAKSDVKIGTIEFKCPRCGAMSVLTGSEAPR